MPPRHGDVPQFTAQIGGPAVCDCCGRNFEHGASLSHYDCVASLYLCMWCIAGLLGDVTDWNIVDQMRNWLTSKGAGRKPFWREYTPLVDSTPTD